MKVLNFDDDDDERKKSTKKIEKKPTLAQTIDQVMTIKTHTESSKTELSSRGKRPFKVWQTFFNSLNVHASKTLNILENFLKCLVFKKCERV